MTPTPFGLALKTVRQRRGLSQSKLAETLDCDHSYVSRLEMGARFPSREFVEHVIRTLPLPREEANALLAAGGWLPEPAHLPFSDPLLLELGAVLRDTRLPRETAGKLRVTLAFLVDAARLSLRPTGDTP